ncbi:MAG: Sigma-70, region 4 [Pseudomonadota bacterium]|jgi:transposase
MMAAIGTDPASEARAEVMRLHYLEGLSVRAIAKRLRLSRKTIRRYLGRSEPAPILQRMPLTGSLSARGSSRHHSMAHERDLQWG